MGGMPGSTSGVVGALDEFNGREGDDGTMAAGRVTALVVAFDGPADGRSAASFEFVHPLIARPTATTQATKPERFDRIRLTTWECRRAGMSV
jgi:hypothetical protein